MNLLRPKCILTRLHALLFKLLTWHVPLVMWMQVHGQNLPGWTLVWSDEFTQTDNSLPDSSKWDYDIGGTGWGNNELQYYTNRTQNARIENNQLVIQARRETHSEKEYTSARLLTKNKAAWTYGRIEARIKVPRGQGIWPAFWMLGADIDAVGWPVCGEIDIMENIGREPSILHGTVHGPGYSGGGAIGGDYTLPGGAKLADDFHVYAIEWEENRIRWFMDGIPYFTVTPGNLPAGSTWVFDKPQHLLLNVAVGGNWPGNPDGTTVFPQRMTVDYVRVYKSGVDTGGNLLSNPSFENGALTHWSSVGPNVYVEPGLSHSGSRAVKVFGQFNGAANESGAYQQLPSAAGDTYAASAWMFTLAGDKIAGANAAWVEVTFRDAAGAILGLHRSETMTSASTASEWRNFPVSRQLNPQTGEIIAMDTELVAPVGTAFVRKQMVFRQPAFAAGAVWFDDLNLTKITKFEPSPFDSWIAEHDFSTYPNPDLTTTGDPDGDGANNLLEFALNGDPTSPAASDKLCSRIEEITGSQVLVITLPVREPAVFDGSPAMSALVSGLTYVIEGTDDLDAFDQQVIEIPASADGMPGLDPGWTYRSFRLDGTASTSSKGFLRVRIMTAPEP